MKLLLPLLLLLTPVFFSCDDYDKISDNQEQSFMKFFGGGLEDEGMKVLNTDGGYLIMGNILNQGKGHDICVIFTDKYGNSTSPIMVYGGEFDDYGYGIAEVSTEGYVIVGSTVSEVGDKQVFIVKITPKGDTLWTKNYGDEFDDEAFDVLVRENGNLILCGYTEVNELNKDYLLVETNANGDLIRFKKEGRAIESEVAQSLVQVDSKFLLAGYSYGSSETNKKALAILWDGISQPTAKPFNIGLHSQANSICSDGNNGYYMACTVQPDQSIQSDIYILKLNQYLEEGWRKSFGERARNVASDIAFSDNFLLINGTTSDVAGSASDNNISGDMLILKTDISGDNPKYFYVGDGTSFQGNGLSITPDGGYIITGSNYINSVNSVITLCKLNSEGTYIDY